MSRAVSSGGGRALGPTPGDRGASRQLQTQHPVAPPARGGRGTELTAGAFRPRADREAPDSRPAWLGPDGRCPRTPAAALNSLLLQSSGGGSGGGGGGEGEGEGEGGCDGSDPGVGLRARTPLPLARPRADAAPRARLAQLPLPPLPLPGQSRTRPALAALTRPGSAPDGPAAVRRRGRVGSGKKALKNRISR